MNNITKASQITWADVADYLRISELSTDDQKTITNMIGVAKSYILKYTGVSDIDASQDFVIVVFVLVQDMWDNRTLYVDTNNVNKVVESILDLYSVNLLPTEELK